jgi:hypothetical protein
MKAAKPPDALAVQALDDFTFRFELVGIVHRVGKLFGEYAVPSRVLLALRARAALAALAGRPAASGSLLTQGRAGR